MKKDLTPLENWFFHYEPSENVWRAVLIKDYEKYIKKKVVPPVVTSSDINYLIDYILDKMSSTKSAN